MAHKYAIDDRLYNKLPADESTGLPSYPKIGGATATRLRDVQKQLTTTADRVNAALTRALEQLQESFEAEDRAALTQARVDALTRRNTRRI